MIFIKKALAFLCGIFGISDLYLYFLNKKHKNNYVRIINYHNTEKENLELFERQLAYYEKKFSIIDFDQLKLFLDDKLCFREKPGMLITFDDGYVCQYEWALDVLKKHDIKSIFFISSEKYGETDPNYIRHDKLKEICDCGHTIGDHTSSHYRFTDKDTLEKLNHEIIDSKVVLQEITGQEIDSFCYVGGEVPVYTEDSFKIIKNNYEYCFTTLTRICTRKTNKHLIHRTNIESYWNMNMVKLNVSGIWDLYYADKARKIEEKLIDGNLL